MSEVNAIKEDFAEEEQELKGKEAAEEVGIISHIQASSFTDGPGERSVVYIKGCPLHCIWCNKPQLIELKPQLLFDKSKCKYCFNCATACVRREIAAEENKAFECNFCGDCVESCPTGARLIVGQPYLAEEIANEVEEQFKDKINLALTFSGGEPYAQSEFVLQSLKEAKKRNINTAVETCGYAFFDAIEPTLEYLDYVLFDFKMLDANTHKYYTGADNKLILENLNRILKLHDNVIIRIPVITDVNDDLETLKEMAKYLSTLKIKRIEIIPFSKEGMEYYSVLGISIEEDFFKEPSEKRLERIKALFSLVCADVEIIR